MKLEERVSLPDETSRAQYWTKKSRGRNVHHDHGRGVDPHSMDFHQNTPTLYPSSPEAHLLKSRSKRRLALVLMVTSCRTSTVVVAVLWLLSNTVQYVLEHSAGSVTKNFLVIIMRESIGKVSVLLPLLLVAAHFLLFSNLFLTRGGSKLRYSTVLTVVSYIMTAH